MSNIPSVQPPQHFLELIKRLYEKRDQILVSTNKLVDYAGMLDNYKKDDEIIPILSAMWKEINNIISYLHELAPHLKNPGIVDHVSGLAKDLTLQIEQAKLHPTYFIKIIAMMVRTGICQEANKTELRPTPKSIKQAFGITVSSHDIKLSYEHQQENY